MINSVFVILIILVFAIIVMILNWDKLFSNRDEEKYIKICPKCGLTKIAIDFSNPAVWAYGATSKYKCTECGFLSNSFPEIAEDNIKNYKKELKHKKAEGNLKQIKTELIDTSTGYSVGIFEIILGAVGFVLIPIFLLIDGFDSLLLFLLFWTLLMIYLVYRIYKRRK